MNENSILTINEARTITGSVVETMLRRAFDPARMDDFAGAEAAKFVFRARREGLLVAALDDTEHAVSPPSMVDPAVADAADAILVAADEICLLVTRKMHAMAPELAENVRRGLSGERTPEPRLIAGCRCCHPVSAAR
jgi:hypothetical protein